MPASFAPYADIAPAASLVHVGHRAGSYRHYPSAPDPEQTDITQLMEHAFDVLGLDGIEVDVRLSDVPGAPLVLLHDPVSTPLEGPELAYVRRNTLEALLKRYAAGGWHQRGKVIYLDLKGDYDPDGLSARGRSMVEHLERTLSAHDPAVRSGVGFMGFNPHLLEALHGSLGKDATLHPFLLLATSNQYPAWLFRLLTPVPAFDEQVHRWATEAAWLDGVVFDPVWVDGFASIFNGIQAGRRKAKLQPLDVFLAIYSDPPEAYVELLAEEQERAGEGLQRVRGLVYEVHRE